jgi:hypothetical protein
VVFAVALAQRRHSRHATVAHGQSNYSWRIIAKILPDFGAGYQYTRNFLRKKDENRQKHFRKILWMRVDN